MIKNGIRVLLLNLTLLICLFMLGVATISANDSIPINTYSCSLSPEQEKEIDAYVLRQMKAGTVPGVSVVVVQGEKTVYNKGFGYADLQAKSPVTPKTFFELASNSKAFTGLGILQLEKKGLINLNDPVREYLPWLSASYQGQAVDITLEQFLHHTSGIPFKTIGEIPISDGDDALEKTVRNLTGVSLVSPPGTRFLYATINYDVLGLVIAEVSGESFEEFMAKNVLSTLGMNQTYLRRKDILPEELAAGHKIGFGKPLAYQAPFYRGNTPAAYFVSNAEDMVRWLSLQLGAVEMGSQVEDELIRRSHIPFKGQSYACGWHVTETGLLWHGGNNPDYSSSIVIDPAQNLGVAVLGNLNSTFVNYCASGILTCLQGQDPNRPIADPYKNVDGIATMAVYILIPLVLGMLFLMFLIIVGNGKKQRNFAERGVKGWIVTGVVGLLLAGYTYLIYLVPRVVFGGLNWGFLSVWAPVTLILTVIGLSCLVYLVGVVLLVKYYFPKKKKQIQSLPVSG